MYYTFSTLIIILIIIILFVRILLVCYLLLVNLVHVIARGRVSPTFPRIMAHIDIFYTRITITAAPCNVAQFFSIVVLCVFFFFHYFTCVLLCLGKLAYSIARGLISLVYPHILAVKPRWELVKITIWIYMSEELMHVDNDVTMFIVKCTRPSPKFASGKLTQDENSFTNFSRNWKKGFFLLFYYFIYLF